MKAFLLIVEIPLMAAALTVASIHGANVRIAFTILYCFLSWILMGSLNDDNKN